MTKALSEQIAELQSQFSFQEDSIRKMSDEIYAQQRRIDNLEQQVERLKAELQKSRIAEPDISTEAEIPPHY